MAASLKLGKWLFATVGGVGHCFLLQANVESKLDRPPPVKVTVDRSAVVVSPWITRTMVNDDDGGHPHNKKWGAMNSDGSWTGGHQGDHSNILQFVMNAVIYAEVENIPRVRLDEDVQMFLQRDMMPTLPQTIKIDRQEGRMDKNNESSTCGSAGWFSCRVNITSRAQVADYYFKQYMPTDCGDPDSDSLVIHLRRPEYKLKDYMQPPCELYKFVIEEGKYTSVRVFGEHPNPCGEWIKNYTTEAGIELDNQIGRDFKLDFCDAARAKNIVMGVSTMSQNAVLLGGRSGRRLYQLLPPHVGDPFSYFGQGDGYFKQLCEVFDVTGIQLQDESYWDMSLDMKAKMYSKTLGIKTKPCEQVAK